MHDVIQSCKTLSGSDRAARRILLLLLLLLLLLGFDASGSGAGPHGASQEKSWRQAAAALARAVGSAS